MQHESFEEFAGEKWKSFQVQGWRGFVIKDKLKMVKTKLKKWRVKVFWMHGYQNRGEKVEIERLDLLDDTFGLN